MNLLFVRLELTGVGILSFCSKELASDFSQNDTMRHQIIFFEQMNLDHFLLFYKKKDPGFLGTKNKIGDEFEVLKIGK